jgi:hypothetical protein
MSPRTSAYLFLGLKDDLTAQQVLAPLARRLKTGHVSATIDRLFTSRHVYDLRLIAAVGLIVVVWIFVVAVVTAAGAAYLASMEQTTLSGSHAIAHAVIAGGAAFLKLLGPTLVVFYGVLTWAYQTGNARLGVVDLFACEIDTICRVITVTDMVMNKIKQHSHDRADELASSSSEISASPSFNSEENYFPILDSSVNELQKLEAKVVSHITAFYTFIKAVRDSLRQVADVRQGQGHPPGLHEPHFRATEVLSRRQEVSRNVVYTLYLGLESGRKAISHLVEFEPERTERTIVILISELTAYQFLREQFPAVGEMRHDRLVLRQTDYQAIVPELCRQVEDNEAKFSQPKPPGSMQDQEDRDDEARQWCASYQLLNELKSRYSGISKLPPPPRIPVSG